MIFIKTSENIVNKVYDQTKRTKVQDRSNSIRVIKRKDPVSNAIETVNEVKQKERRVDALALRADERRDKLRKATGRSKYPLIRRCLNGETHMSIPHVSIRQSITYGGEPGELETSK